METLAPIAEQLGIDHTFIYMFVLMFVLYILLSAVYLKPYQKLLAERKKRTDGAKKEAQELTEKAEEKFNLYKTRLKEINEKARHTINENQEAAKKEENKILGEASNKAKQSLQSTQKQLDEQRKATIDALSNDVAGIAAEIATKVMGRPIGTR